MIFAPIWFRPAHRRCLQPRAVVPVARERGRGRPPPREAVAAEDTGARRSTANYATIVLASTRSRAQKPGALSTSVLATLLSPLAARLRAWRKGVAREEMDERYRIPNSERTPSPQHMKKHSRSGQPSKNNKRHTAVYPCREHPGWRRPTLGEPRILRRRWRGPCGSSRRPTTCRESSLLILLRADPGLESGKPSPHPALPGLAVDKGLSIRPVYQLLPAEADPPKSVQLVGAQKPGDLLFNRRVAGQAGGWGDLGLGIFRRGGRHDRTQNAHSSSPFGPRRFLSLNPPAPPG